MLKDLQRCMKEEGISAVIIPTSDPHDTEYVCEHFAARKAFSGFTGSAATLVVLQDKAACWTDGRYYIQAQEQLKPLSITLMKDGLKETPTIDQYLCDQLKDGDIVAYDGKVVSLKQSKAYAKELKEEGICIRSDLDLVSQVWINRPPLPRSKTFILENCYAGASIEQKIEQVRNKMKEHSADQYIVTKVDEVAWLFNLRAHDIENFPVALAYARVSLEKVYLYIDDSRLDENSLNTFQQIGIIIRGYDQIYEDSKELNQKVLVDGQTINQALVQSIPGTIIDVISPIITLKAIKNDIEIENTKHAHIKDGTALVRFMYWLKHSIGKEIITECSAQDQLQAFRKEQEDYIEDSFTTISAYGPHAAMMHYSATMDTDVTLEQKGLYLVDSGAHYYDGTTDITRTFVLGDLTFEEKKWFTLSLVGHIHLSQACWLYGAKGSQLDILARSPLWQQGMDYQCGTGHGVGHVLSVHEDNNGFRRFTTSREATLEAGMITTDEPGVYVENGFGIRHENELLAVNDIKNEYGQFMHFEPITFVPFDKEGLELSLMSDSDIQWLNDYHQQVFDKISPYLPDCEREWLADICQPIVR